ncbi:hypothetical protein JKP88DRAFT_272556 [Tribonema minus]|uniref:EF-hand domain-containing protein n=1 Tax=Tribonema minus TaxID=303371 RepID=A0A836CJZ9_9STRA|nr:hypothetical protein JKP88DRAFT_272556 [Tribonema minus]
MREDRKRVISNPQQLSGGPRYSSRTRVGNWFEDERLEECKFKSFREAKARNELGGGVSRAKLTRCLEQVPLTHSSDGALRFGDTVMLESCETGGALACDPFEEVELGAREYVATVTAARPARAAARTTFTIVPITDRSLLDRAQATLERAHGSTGPLRSSEGSPVLVGQGFHLACDSGLRIDDALGLRRAPLYLASSPRSELRASKAKSALGVVQQRGMHAHSRVIGDSDACCRAHPRKLVSASRFGLGSGVSGRQPVYLKQGATADAVWRFQHTVAGKAGAELAAQAVGAPVATGAPLLLVHRGTLTALCCEAAHRQVTDFGPESELCCYNAAGPGRHMQLEKEAAGRRTASTATKAELQVNRWIVRTAATAAEASATRHLPPELTAESLVDVVVRALAAGSAPHGVRALRRAFKAMDSGSDGRLDRDDLRGGIAMMGVDLDDDQAAALLNRFDKNKDGLAAALARFAPSACLGGVGERRRAFERVRARKAACRSRERGRKVQAVLLHAAPSVEEFMAALAPPLAPQRRALVLEAFAALDKDKSGQITLSDLAAAYDFSSDPRVKAGTITPRQAAAEFMALWAPSASSQGPRSFRPRHAPKSSSANMGSIMGGGGGAAEGKACGQHHSEEGPVVSLAAFERYYAEVGAGLSDDYFEVMLSNAWHLSGATTGLRVLATFKDGHQAVVEVEDDLGLRRNDAQGIMARLAAQGVQGVVSVATKGGGH